MTVSKPTPLQRGRQALAAWQHEGTNSRPPEREIYGSDKHGVSAYIDPFTPFRIGAVVFNHDVAPEGETAHLPDMSYSTRPILGHVVHAVGRKLLAAVRNGEELLVVDPDNGEQRVLERVDGFAIARQSHVRMGVAHRGEPEHPHPSEEELDSAWGATIIMGRESLELDRRLDAQALIGDILNSPLAAQSLQQMEQIAAIVTSPDTTQ